MLTYHIALVSQTSRLAWAELARTSAALQKQILRDFWPTWGVAGTVDAFPTLQDVPGSYWPLFIRELDDDAEAGVFLDEHGRPWAQVAHAGGWTLAASRACLELLINPFGTRRVDAPDPRAPGQRLSFLMEILRAVPRRAAGVRGGWRGGFGLRDAGLLRAWRGGSPCALQFSRHAGGAPYAASWRPSSLAESNRPELVDATCAGSRAGRRAGFCAPRRGDPRARGRASCECAGGSSRL